MPKWKTKMCGCCDRNLHLGCFSTTNKLEGGLYPWCKKCVGEMLKSKDHEWRERYDSAYNRLLQAKYRADNFTSNTRILVDSILDPMRPGSQGLVMGLFETRTWRDFKDGIIKPCAECEAYEEIHLMAVFPTILYPDYIFAAYNYVSLCVTCMSRLSDIFSKRVKALSQYTTVPDDLTASYDEALNKLYAAVEERYGSKRKRAT